MNAEQKARSIVPFHKTVGGRGQLAVCNWLRGKKVGDVRSAGYYCAWDFYVNDLRVEVKTARYSRKTWKVNIHRHGKLKEDVDVYIVRLEGCPLFKAAIHLVIPAPLGTKTLQITPRSLITVWAQYFNAVENLRPKAIAQTI